MLYDERCENCRFFAFREGDVQGQCLRYAPRPSSPLYHERRADFRVTAVWPLVSKGSCCGEFEYEEKE